MLEEKAIEEMLLLTMFSLRMENVRVNEPSLSRMFLFIFLVPFRYNFLLGAFRSSSDFFVVESSEKSNRNDRGLVIYTGYYSALLSSLWKSFIQ